LFFFVRVAAAVKVIYDYCENRGETFSPLSLLSHLLGYLEDRDFLNSNFPNPNGAFEFWLLIRVLFVPNVQ